MPEDANKRTALLVRCTEAEAETIRQAARLERRTISGFILNAVMNRVMGQKKLLENWNKPRGGPKKEGA